MNDNYLWIIGIFVSLISFISFSLLYNYMCHQCTNYEYTNIILFLIFFSLVMFVISCYGVSGSFGCSSLNLFKYKINALFENDNSCLNLINIYENNKKEAETFNFNLEEHLNQLYKIKNSSSKCDANLDLSMFENLANINDLRNSFITLLSSKNYNDISKNSEILQKFVDSSFNSINENISKNELSKKHIIDSIVNVASKYLKTENIVIIKKLFIEK